MIQSLLMRILGIDPGVARTGWGVIHKVRGTFVADDFGCITTGRADVPEARLLQLFQELVGLIHALHPDEVAMEELFFNTNIKTAIAVGQARGVAILAVATQHLPLTHYTPLEVKQAVAGYGRAEKRQVQSMVKSLLSLRTHPSPDDVSDALAVAITHGVTKRFA